MKSKFSFNLIKYHIYINIKLYSPAASAVKVDRNMIFNRASYKRLLTSLKKNTWREDYSARYRRYEKRSKNKIGTTSEKVTYSRYFGCQTAGDGKGIKQRLAQGKAPFNNKKKGLPLYRG